MSKLVSKDSLMQADRILRQDNILTVSDQEYAWLCKLMDQPVRDLPELRALLSETARLVLRSFDATKPVS